jgi:hypothetical protein
MNTAADLAKHSDSTIIILIVVIVICIIALIPVMKVAASIALSKKKQYYEHENLLIQVIEKNTEVNSALKTLIEADQKHCADCKREQLNRFDSLDDKLSEISQKIGGKKND